MLDLWLLLIVCFSGCDPSKCEADWTYDFVSVEVENKTPHIVNVQAEVTRPRRGVFALSGFVHLQQDVTDQAKIGGATFYSLTGSNFVRTAFAMPESNLSTILNSYYKEYVMESIVNCSDEAPQIDDNFVPPLTKRLVRFNDCFISTENLPSNLKRGYYKIIIWYSDFGEGSVELIIKVESK